MLFLTTALFRLRRANSTRTWKPAGKCGNGSPSLLLTATVSSSFWEVVYWATWVAFVQQLAARHGFVPSAVPGRLLMPSADGASPPLLSLVVDAAAAEAEDTQGSAVRVCLLTLDVPQIDEAVEPFPMFYRVVNELASALDATAVDNEGLPLSLQAFATIGRELDELYQQLRALDLAAGSPAARRLFS